MSSKMSSKMSSQGAVFNRQWMGIAGVGDGFCPSAQSSPNFNGGVWTPSFQFGHVPG